MVTPPSIITDHLGRTIVVKSATGALAARRRHEAALLGRSRHPCVVELLEVVDDGDHVELHLDHVAGPPLALHSPLAAGELARIGAAVAETLADLHRSGVAHGHVAGDHVLITDDRVVLCGFADATDFDDDRGRADVVDLARLLRRQLDRSTESRSIGDDDRAGQRLRETTEGLVADGADVPTARDLAARLAAIADVGDPGEARRGPLVRAGLGRRGAAIATVVAALTVAAALVAVRSIGAGGDDAAAIGSPPATAVADSVPVGPASTVADLAPTTATSPADADPMLVLPAPTACAPPIDPMGATADVDGDGCPDEWRAEGGVLEVGSLRYSLGGPSDLVAVGDWDCDDMATPALVQIESGGVFLFPRWAGAGDDITVEAIGLVSGPLSATVRSTGGCDVLEVAGADGNRSFGGRS